MDPELAAIRAKRMAEMKQQTGMPAGMAGGPPQEDQQQKQQAMEERRHAMLTQILSPEARERRISI